MAGFPCTDPTMTSRSLIPDAMASVPASLKNFPP
jgi:hypothetical protein